MGDLFRFYDHNPPRQAALVSWGLIRSNLLLSIILRSNYRDIKWMSMNKVNRGEKVINAAVSAHKMTECGASAFYAAVDPFHDKPIQGLNGWPDLQTSQSVVRHIKRTVTVKAVEDGGAIMVYTWPILNNNIIHSVARTNNLITTILDGVNTDSDVGPVVIYNYSKLQASGASLPLSNVAGGRTVQALPNEYFEDGPIRLLGMGVEVHDVTAEIYKQGTITCFEIPQAVFDKEGVYTAEGLNPTGEPGVTYTLTPTEVARMERFPSTLNDIMLMPSTRQWDAKEGCYTVVTLNNTENPPVYAEYRTPWVDGAPSTTMDLPNQLNFGDRYIGDYFPGTVGADPANYFLFYPNAYIPANSKGIFITGLNANSTFTITSSFYFESFPTQKSNLMPVARPSCEYDPKALQLISLVQKMLPVGVPVKDNDLGEWFWEAVETVVPWLTTGASLAMPEFSPAIVAAGAYATNYASKRTKQGKKKKLAKQKLKNEVKRDVKTEIKRIEGKPAGLSLDYSRQAGRGASRK